MSMKERSTREHLGPCLTSNLTLVWSIRHAFRLEVGANLSSILFISAVRPRRLQPDVVVIYEKIHLAADEGHLANLQ